MPALQDIFYSDAILQWAAQVNQKKIPDINNKRYCSPIVQNSRLCGSRLRLYAQFQPSPNDNILADIVFDVRACKLGAAAAAITEKYYSHATYSDVLEMTDFLKKTLTPSCDEAVLNQKKKIIKGGEDFYLFRPFATYNMRHESIQLAATALIRSFD